MNAHTTAQEWFALGEKVPYDRRTEEDPAPGRYVSHRGQ